MVKDETSVLVWRLYKANRTRLVTLEVSLSNTFRSLAFSFSPLSAPLLPNVPSIPHRDLKKKKILQHVDSSNSHSFFFPFSK